MVILIIIMAGTIIGTLQVLHGGTRTTGTSVSGGIRGMEVPGHGTVVLDMEAPTTRTTRRIITARFIHIHLTAATTLIRPAIRHQTEG